MKTYQKVIIHILSILSTAVMYVIAFASLVLSHYGHPILFGEVVLVLLLIVFGINVFLLAKKDLGKWYRYALVIIIVGILLFSYLQLVVVWGVWWWA